jgi:hypothetical protein
MRTIPVVKDMRDDHARRRSSPPTPASPASPAGRRTGIEPGPDPDPNLEAGRARAADRGIRWLLAATGACIVGCAGLIAAGGSNLTMFLGISLGGIAFVLVLSTVFYAVGRSEDRERAERRSRQP